MRFSPEKLPHTNMRRIIFLLASIFCFLTFSFGQSQSTTGNIEGRVVDQNGAVVPNVAVSATNQDTGLNKTTVTDGDDLAVFTPVSGG